MDEMRSRHILVTGVAAALLLAALFFSLGVGVTAAQTEAGQPEVAAAAGWLVSAHQNEDGGYTSFSTGAGEAASDVAGTVDAVLALAGAGYNVAAPVPGRQNTPIGFLQANDEALVAYARQGGGAAGKVVLALAAAARDPRTFAGHDFVVELTGHLSPTGQLHADNAFNQSLALLAYRTVSATVPASATEWLLNRQAGDGELAGSWGDGFGTMGNVDATALAAMALLAAGRPVSDTALLQAVDFLAQTQLESGGWPYAPGLAESANSTALAVQALSALGEDFYSDAGRWAGNGISPLAALRAWQGESGAFQADFGDGRADDFFTTVQALPAAAGRPYPLPARYEAARRAVACLATLQDPASGGWEEFAGAGANAGGTSRAIQAITAFGGDPSGEQWTVQGTNALEALESLTPAYLVEGRGGRVGVVLQGVVPAGGDVSDFAGYNLVISVTNYLSPTGEYADTTFGPFSHAEAMLGLLAAGEPADPSALAWLLEAQSGGDWGDPDGDGISLQVLGRTGQSVPGEVITAAVAHLQETQQADGGWGFAFPSSVNTTAEVVQGLAAVGHNPFVPSWSRVLSGTLRNAADLALAQQAEDGCWPNQFGPGADPFATTDGILLLLLEPEWGPPVEVVEIAEESTATSTAAVATATSVATGTPTAAAVVQQETATPTMAASPTAEAAVVAPTTTPPQVTGEVENDRTNPTLAWLLLGLAALFVIAAAVWVYVGRRL